MGECPSPQHTEMSKSETQKCPMGGSDMGTLSHVCQRWPSTCGPDVRKEPLPFLVHLLLIEGFLGTGGDPGLTGW